MYKMNKKQQLSLLRKWQQANQSMTYLQFRRTVQSGIGMDCVIVLWCNMWLGIETNGHTHS